MRREESYLTGMLIGLATPFIEISAPLVTKYRKEKELSLGHAGRPKTLSKEDEQALLNAFRGLRDAGIAIVAAAVATCAIGIAERSKKGSTVLVGGNINFCRT